MPEYLHGRHFSVEEANALLPKLTVLLIRMHEALERFQGQKAEAIQALRVASTNGKHRRPQGEDALDTLREITADIEAYGCIVKDYEKGLLDFPSVRDGKEVYLCWMLGEPEITCWHEVESGFAGRKPL